MKKRSLKVLKLNKERVSAMNAANIVGGETRGSCGVVCPFGPKSDSMDNNCNTVCCRE